ncbi:hypothetical protein HMPREF0400_00664 [Fusobacterium periodonticum 1_1_41FAA]|uniref:Uncharacterized protein n=1 Tax=Fusobacterium periodonticum 1_1_41FAA TaxID=469621 RepID=D6LG15_9FUSO|nr:hypothetical protein HMPREF0400_00664 [Fusobacterium periodonticum 1_1_41FAA]
MEVRAFIMSQLIEFPSPYGVSFILMKDFEISSAQACRNVSVSLWSIIHSYLMLVYINTF